MESQAHSLENEFSILHLPAHYISLTHSVQLNSLDTSNATI